MRAWLSLPILFAVPACGGETPCPAPAAHWLRVAPANADTIVVDRHDRIVWNGELTSQERLRDTLNKADATGRTVTLAPQPGASCTKIQTVRLAMERSLSCGTGRCAETAPD